MLLSPSPEKGEVARNVFTVKTLFWIFFYSFLTKASKLSRKIKLFLPVLIWRRLWKMRTCQGKYSVIHLFRDVSEILCDTQHRHPSPNAPLMKRNARCWMFRRVREKKEVIWQFRFCRVVVKAETPCCFHSGAQFVSGFYVLTRLVKLVLPPSCIDRDIVKTLNGHFVEWLIIKGEKEYVMGFRKNNGNGITKHCVRRLVLV